MTFTIVEIPKGASTPLSPIVNALLENIGKAISIPCEGRDANSIRKTVRFSLSSKGLLKKYNFRTRIAEDGNSITVWLEEKTVTGPTEQVTAEAQKDKR